MSNRCPAILVLVLAVGLVTGPASAGGFVSFLEFYEHATNLDYVKALVTTSDGVFVVSVGIYGDVTTFSRAPGTGALTFVDHVNVVGASDAVLSPDDRHLYLATGDDSVLAYSRNVLTGTITFVDRYSDGDGNIDGLDVAVGIAVSPDGNNVYATGANDNGLAVFSRDPATGALTFLEVHLDGVGGVDGIANPRDVAVSPDGAHVYVAGSGDNSVAVFLRSPATGTLTWQGKVTDAIGGVAGLNGVYRVTTDPDGDHVYTGGQAVAVFVRNPATGLLSYVEHHDLSFSRGIVVDHTGGLLFASSETEDSLSVFNRDSTTGALTLSDSAMDGADGVDGMETPNTVALDPRSSTIYVGCEHDTLAVFQVGMFRDGFESGDLSGW
jgi:6-phosphogluconolactonase (cycloisomerase 2 family)